MPITTYNHFYKKNFIHVNNLNYLRRIYKSNLDKKWIYYLLSAAAIILVYSLYVVYMYFINQDFFNKEYTHNPVAIFTQKFSFKINLIPRLILVLIFTFINTRLIYLIFRKSNSENIYYAKIKNWTNFVMQQAEGMNFHAKSHGFASRQIKPILPIDIIQENRLAVVASHQCQLGPACRGPSGSACHAEPQSNTRRPVRRTCSLIANRSVMPAM